MKIESSELIASGSRSVQFAVANLSGDKEPEQINGSQLPECRMPSGVGCIEGNERGNNQEDREGGTVIPTRVIKRDYVGE